MNVKFEIKKKILQNHQVTEAGVYSQVRSRTSRIHQSLKVLLDQNLKE